MCEPSFVVRPSSVYTVALYEKTRYLSSSILREAWRLQSRERVGAARAIYTLRLVAVRQSRTATSHRRSLGEAWSPQTTPERDFAVIRTERSLELTKDTELGRMNHVFPEQPCAISK